MPQFANGSLTNREEILQRLRCVHGHVRGVERMVAAGSSCLEVTQQLDALQGSLHKIALLILEDLLHSALQDGGSLQAFEEQGDLLADLYAIFSPHLGRRKPFEGPERLLASEGELDPRDNMVPLGGGRG